MAVKMETEYPKVRCIHQALWTQLEIVHKFYAKDSG